MQILPVNNYVLVELDNESEKTETGLLVPGVKGDKAEAYAIRAIVKEISKEVTGKLAWKVGDKVLVAKWEGQNVSANGTNYILIKPEHVMALLK